MVKERLTKRQQQAAQTKERIKQETAKLINELGYANIKISDICRAAGISNGNFYHYFSCKDDVLLSMYSSFDDYVEGTFTKLSFENNLEAIRSLIYIQVCGSKETTAQMQVQLFQAQLNIQGGYVVAEERYVHRYLKELIHKAVEAGEIHPSHDVDRTAQLIFQVARGILFDWAMRGGTFDKEKQILLALDLLLAALKLPEEKPTPPSEGLPLPANNQYDSWARRGS